MTNASGLLDGGLVAVAGQIPHGDLVTLADRLAGDLGICQRGAPHVDHR